MGVPMNSLLLDAVVTLLASPKFRDWKPSHDREQFFIRDLEHDDQMAEKHFTPQELAEMWQVSIQTIRQIFESEEGVLKIGRDGTRTRRRYKTLRIPESVAERVHTRMSA
jgi:hypothetical protein